MIPKPDKTKELPNSSAPKEGITDNVLGDAKRSDLDRGFCKVDEYTPTDMLDYEGSMFYDGFLGRPSGYER